MSLKDPEKPILIPGMLLVFGLLMYPAVLIWYECATTTAQEREGVGSSCLDQPFLDISQYPGLQSGRTGGTMPEPAPEKSLLVDSSIHLRLKVVAARSGMTIQQVVEQALLAYLPQVEAKWSK